jgi:hypothetical protein
MGLVVKGERLNFDFYHRCSGGEVRDVVVNSGTVHIHGRELLLSIVHDITASSGLNLPRDSLMSSFCWFSTAWTLCLCGRSLYQRDPLRQPVHA